MSYHMTNWNNQRFVFHWTDYGREMGCRMKEARYRWKNTRRPNKRVLDEMSCCPSHYSMRCSDCHGGNWKHTGRDCSYLALCCNLPVDGQIGRNSDSTDMMTNIRLSHPNCNTDL